jgi:type IV secretory pathway TraG/TraD family ATPase VirD4
MKADKMILGTGKNAVYSMDSNVTGLNNNVIVCAGSGCGKTVSIMEPRLLQTTNSSLVVTVTKRRLVDKYKYMFLERGYDVLDLNFVSPLESNVAYDPLQYVSSYADITFLAESIVRANPRKDKSNADPYWDDASISLLSALIAYVLMTEEKPTFADVLRLNDRLSIKDGGGQIETSLDDMFDGLMEIDPNCFAITCWNSFRVLPIKTGSCVYGTLNTTLDTIFTPELRKMIGHNENVDFEYIASRKTVLFVTTSAVNPSLNCFINMFYAQMFKQLFEFAETRPSGQLPLDVGVLADDFATGCRILNFPEYISIFREKRINVTLLIQSESQLERMYGYEDAITIINNCDTYVYMGGMDIRTGRNISARLNAPLEDVLYMPVGQEIIFRRGQRPVVTQRYNIYEDKLYQAVTMQYNDMVAAAEKRERG